MPDNNGSLEFLDEADSLEDKYVVSVTQMVAEAAVVMELFGTAIVEQAMLTNDEFMAAIGAKLQETGEKLDKAMNAWYLVLPAMPSYSKLIAQHEQENET